MPDTGLLPLTLDGPGTGECSKQPTPVGGEDIMTTTGGRPPNRVCLFSTQQYFERINRPVAVPLQINRPCPARASARAEANSSPRTRVFSELAAQPPLIAPIEPPGCADGFLARLGFPVHHRAGGINRNDPESERLELEGLLTDRIGRYGVDAHPPPPRRDGVSGVSSP